MKKQLKILVADDEVVGRQLLEAILVPEGYDLLLCNDGQQALDAALNQQPDLILLDVMMPHMDGFEVCQKIRANPPTSHIPIFLITALDDRDSRIRGIDSGADDYISKPFDRIEILGKLKNKIRYIEKHGSQIDHGPEKVQKESDASISPECLKLLKMLLENHDMKSRVFTRQKLRSGLSRHAFTGRPVASGDCYLFSSVNIRNPEASLMMANLIRHWTDLLLSSVPSNKIIPSCSGYLDNYLKKALKEDPACSLVHIHHEDQSETLKISGLNHQILVMTASENGEKEDPGTLQQYNLTKGLELSFTGPGVVLLLSGEYLKKASPEEAFPDLNSHLRNSNPEDALEEIEKAFGKEDDLLAVYLSF